MCPLFRERKDLRFVHRKRPRRRMGNGINYVATKDGRLLAQKTSGLQAVSMQLVWSEMEMGWGPCWCILSWGFSVVPLIQLCGTSWLEQIWVLYRHILLSKQSIKFEPIYQYRNSEKNMRYFPKVWCQNWMVLSFWYRFKEIWWSWSIA